MIISFLILVIGYQLFRDSLVAIINPQQLKVDIITLVVLAVAMAMKLWLFIFYRTIGKKIGSQVLAASAADSLGDVLSTGAVLVAAIVIHFTKWYFLDGAVGIIVACLIVWQGIKILLESMHAILGEAPSEELVEQIEAIVMTYPEALGIHDMIVHNYGPGHTIASLHVEVDGAMDIFHAHDAIDNIEREIQKKLGVITTVHMDPIVVGDPIVDELREKMLVLVKEIDARMSIHDFRFVDGITHKNLIFDVTVPFEIKKSDEEIESEIKTRVSALDPLFQCVLTIDRQ
jgi:cation diffusion facilitator family transporter